MAFKIVFLGVHLNYNDCFVAQHCTGHFHQNVMVVFYARIVMDSVAKYLGKDEHYMDIRKVGFAIKSLRQQLSLTQKELAEMLGVTDKAVSKWERGLGAPDISLVNKLSDILNIDTDNLLAGNVAYLEKEWVGILDVDNFRSNVSIMTNLNGKPIIFLYLCYFALAGIKKVSIIANGKEEKVVKQAVGNGKGFGLEIKYNEEFCNTKRQMIIDGPDFIYGPNLTKCFQRAMSNKNTCTTLVAIKQSSNGNNCISGQKTYAKFVEQQQYYKTHIHFKSNEGEKEIFEPMPRGIIVIEIYDENNLADVVQLYRIIENNSSEHIYNLEEIAYRRGLI